MRELDHIDLLLICAEGLEPLQALDLIRWHIGRDADGLPSIAGYREMVANPGVLLWIKRNAQSICAAYAAEAYNK